jgi:acyl carrier protein
MNLLSQISAILTATLQQPIAFDENTPLLGAIPEFDSMAVVSIVTALEDRFGFTIEDDEIDAEVFASVASLMAFVQEKLAAG